MIDITHEFDDQLPECCFFMMDTSSPVPLLLPVTFYGRQSKRRSLSIRHSLENRTKRLKDEKIPDAYHSRLLGPSTCWQIFYRQQEALDFVNSKAEQDLHVFAFECRQPDKQTGQRQFLAASYPVMWHYYMQLDPDQKHHYEVIPEGCPCKLYFDLEFQKPVNPCADGAWMVEILIKYVCIWLKELYDVQCNREAVLELTASTETKFSRHLIFQPEDTAFTDNVTAGHFIRAIFALLEDHLHYGKLEELKAKQDNGELPTKHGAGGGNTSESSCVNPLINQVSSEQSADHKSLGENASVSSHANTSFSQSCRELSVDNASQRENSSGSFHTNPSLSQGHGEASVTHELWEEKSSECTDTNPLHSQGRGEASVTHEPWGEKSSESTSANPSLNKGSSKPFVDHRTWRKNTSEYPDTSPSHILAPDSVLTGHLHKEQSGKICADHDCMQHDGCSGDNGEFSDCRSAARNSARPMTCVKNQGTENEESASSGSMCPKGMGCVGTGEDVECCAVEQSRNCPYKPQLRDSVGSDANCDEIRTACAKDAAATEPVRDERWKPGKAEHQESVKGEHHSEREYDQTRVDCPTGKTKAGRVCAGEHMEMEESMSSQIKMEESISEKGETSGGDLEMETKLRKLFNKVRQQFKTDELRSLFVKDRDGRDTCFADLGVYTKNRNFRLYKSCKLGKTTAFTVAEQNTYHVGSVCDDKNRDQEIFLASLITNVRESGRKLTFENRPTGTQKPCRSRKSCGTKEQVSGEHIEGSGKSPYPEIDDFIADQVSGCGQGGAIRRWTYFPAAEILSYDIVGYRFCYNVQRQHRSNNIRLVADLQRGVWYQKCYDPDCQSVNFKSQEFRLPERVLPAYYLADDFEDLTEDDVDEDDTACLLALQDVEQRTMAELQQ